MYQENDEMEIDLLEIFHVMKEKAVIIILTTLIFALGSGLISAFLIQPTYQSTAKVLILTRSTSITSLTDIQLGSSLTSDYMELIKSRPVVEGVIENLKLDLTYEQLLKKLEVVNQTDTRILNISVKDEDPNMAKAIADDFARVSRKQIADIMKIDTPSIVENAVVAKNPISPNVKKNILIGLLLGFILSSMVIVLRHLLDDTIKTTEDIEKYLGLNTLAVVPLLPGTVPATKRSKAKRAKAGKRRGR